MNLLETRIAASRHLSDEEKEAVVETIKFHIADGKWKIQDKPKNREFKRFSRLSEKEIIDIIYQHISPRNIVAVIPNRNYPSKGSIELYLLKMYIKKFSVYVKVDVTDNKAEFWSIHSLTSSLDRDYQYASDYSENNLPKTFAWEWQQNYNSIAPKGYKIINRFVNDMTVHFDFECGNVTYENAKNFFKQLMDSKPKRLYDIYYIGKSMQLDLVAGGIEIELTEKN